MVMYSFKFGVIKNSKKYRILQPLFIKCTKYCIFLHNQLLRQYTNGVIYVLVDDVISDHNCWEKTRGNYVVCILVEDAILDHNCYDQGYVYL